MPLDVRHLPFVPDVRLLVTRSIARHCAIAMPSFHRWSRVETIQTPDRWTISKGKEDRQPPVALLLICRWISITTEVFERVR